MKKLLIIGTSEYAEVAAYYLSDKYDVIGFSEEAAYRKLPDLQNRPIHNFESIPDLFDPSQVRMLVAIGPNRVNSVRERLYSEVKKIGFQCIKYVHPSATVWDIDAIGDNSFIFPNCVIEPYSTIGSNSIMWSGAILAHHSEVKDHCFMAPGSAVSGRSVIKNNCFLGINSTVRDNVIVEERCIIGAGSVIKKNTVAGGVYSDKGTELYRTDSEGTKV